MNAPRLKSRSDVHLARKIWHVLGVLVIFVVYTKSTRLEALQIITVAGFLGIGTDILRQEFGTFNVLVLKILAPVMRKSEKNHMAGTSYLFLGMFLIILFFPRNIVMLTMLLLAVADPVSSYVGIRWGKDKIVGEKSLQGTAAGFVASALVAVLFYYVQNIMTERLLVVSLITGVIGALSELIPVWKLDDNLTLPVFSACFLYVLFYVFGGF